MLSVTVNETAVDMGSYDHCGHNHCINLYVSK